MMEAKGVVWRVKRTGPVITLSRQPVRETVRVETCRNRVEFT